MVSYKPHYACFNCRKTFLKELGKVMKSDLSFLEVGQSQQVKLKYKGIMTKIFITSVEFLQN